MHGQKRPAMPNVGVRPIDAVGCTREGARLPARRPAPCAADMTPATAMMTSGISANTIAGALRRAALACEHELRAAPGMVPGDDHHVIDAVAVEVAHDRRS